MIAAIVARARTAVAEAAPEARSAKQRNRTRRRRQAARLFRFDRALGTRFVAGADEAGRGSLAGPLVAAGVLIDYGTLSRRDRRALSELDDSKMRSPEEREDLYPRVLRAATRVAVTPRPAPPPPPPPAHAPKLAPPARRHPPTATTTGGLP